MTLRTLTLLTASFLLIPLSACTDKTEASGPGSGGGGTVLVVQAAPGTFEVACKPGMVGDGIRSKFVVTDS